MVLKVFYSHFFTWHYQQQSLLWAWDTWDCFFMRTKGNFSEIREKPTLRYEIIFSRPIMNFLLFLKKICKQSSIKCAFKIELEFWISFIANEIKPTWDMKGWKKEKKGEIQSKIFLVWWRFLFFWVISLFSEISRK